MPKKPAYIVLLAHGAAGAEKRFTDNWLWLRRNGYPAHLVVSELTYRMLLLQPGFEEIAQHRDYVHVFHVRSRRYLATAAGAMTIVRAIPRGSIVHYPLAPILALSAVRGHDMIVSWVSTRPPSFQYDWSGKRVIIPWLSFLEAKHIDVLNPTNVSFLQRNRVIRRKVALTRGGTLVNFEIYRPAEKKNWVVFLGRLEAEKNALAFARLIPHIARHLQVAGIAVPSFFLLGDGEETQAIKGLIAGPDYRQLDIQVGHMSRPHEILQHAKIFVSLQRTSNYPSKALAEGMACGCLPVITDVGESRLMASPSFARFIGHPLQGSEVAACISELLGLPEAKFSNLSKEASQFAARHFSIQAQASYFATLYWGDHAQ